MLLKLWHSADVLVALDLLARLGVDHDVLLDNDNVLVLVFDLRDELDVIWVQLGQEDALDVDDERHFLEVVFVLGHLLRQRIKVLLACEVILDIHRSQEVLDPQGVVLGLSYEDALLSLENLRIIGPGCLLDLDDLIVNRLLVLRIDYIVLQAALVKQLALNLVVLYLVADLLVDLIVAAFEVHNFLRLLLLRHCHLLSQLHALRLLLDRAEPMNLSTLSQSLREQQTLV